MKLIIFVGIFLSIYTNYLSQNNSDFKSFIKSYDKNVSLDFIITSEKESSQIYATQTIPDNIMKNFLCLYKNYCLFKDDSIKVQYYRGLKSELSKNIDVITYREVHSFNNQRLHLITYNRKKKKIIDHVLIREFWEDKIFTSSEINPDGGISIYRAFSINEKESNVYSFFWAKVFHYDYKINKKTGEIILNKATVNRELLIQLLKRGKFIFYGNIKP